MSICCGSAKELGQPLANGKLCVGFARARDAAPGDLGTPHTLSHAQGDPPIWGRGRGLGLGLVNGAASMKYIHIVKNEVIFGDIW